ncbi:MAG: hypothetical protein JW918_03635, partial [Anaerolineae bacterium]|nr:hypothetical protein [Anaerolineae bacterium]
PQRGELEGGENVCPELFPNTVLPPTTNTPTTVDITTPDVLHLLARFQKRVPRPLRLNPAILEHDDVICAAQRRTAVRDHQTGGTATGERAAL